MLYTFKVCNFFLVFTLDAGGGCLYWSESTVDFYNNSLVSNEALYGPDYASSPQNLFVRNVDSFSSPQTSGSKLTIPIEVVMQDFYGHVVRTGGYIDATFSIVITASTVDLISSISGSTIEVFNEYEGVTIFPDLTVTLRPASHVVLLFDAQGEGGISNVEMDIFLRRCVRGEIVESITDTQYKCTKCPSGKYSFNPEDAECTPCPLDATCPGGDVIVPDRGFWRQCETCVIIEQCIYPDNCIGSGNISEQCASGNTGPLCNVCEDGYSRDTQGRCNKCGSIGILVNMILSSVFAFIIIFIIIVYVFRKAIIKMLGKYFHRLEERLERMNWNKHRTKVKIIIAFIQITSGIPALLSVEFHPAFHEFLSVMSYFTMGFIASIDLGCYFSYNFYTTLRVSTLIPPSIMIVIDIYLRTKTFLAERENKASPAYSYKIRNIDRKKCFLYISFFVFSTISTQVFQTFVCERFEDGKSYLVVDSNLECYTTTHERYMAYAGLMVFLYPVGVPLYYAFHLYRKKKFINPPTSMGR